MRKLDAARWRRQFADTMVRDHRGIPVLPTVVRDLDPTSPTHGQALLDAAGRAQRVPGAPRVIRSQIIDRQTGEVRTRKVYRIGYYTGSGFIRGVDGIRVSCDIARFLDQRANYTLAV